MQDIFRRISEQWFLREPAFFSLYCTHPLEENFAMQCAVRSGQHRIEYNPALLKGRTLADVEQLLRIELLRIFMKHPYQRQPEGCSLTAKRLGSDCALSSYGLPTSDTSASAGIDTVCRPPVTETVWESSGASSAAAFPR